MVNKRIRKPKKKSTADLFKAINHSLENNTYYFSDHADIRSKTRKNVNDLEVVKILGSAEKWHESGKDKFVNEYKDWNYHIRGRNSDDDQVRIVISFDENNMVVITVVNLEEAKNNDD